MTVECRPDHRRLPQYLVYYNTGNNKRLLGKLSAGHDKYCTMRAQEFITEAFTPKNSSKQEVINHFLSLGKTAAQGAAAWERGWRGPKQQAKPPKATYIPPQKFWWQDKDEDGVSEGSLNEFGLGGHGGGDDKKSYLLKLASDLYDALYGPNKNKQEVKNIKSKIESEGGTLKISFNPDSSFNVVMYHPKYFKQGYLISLVGGNGEQSVAEDSLNELAPSSNPNGGNYLKALASAWYNGTFNTGNLGKGIKSQEDVERILERGIHCGDGRVRKYNIDYSPNFDGVVIFSDDYYEHSEHTNDGSTIDSRTGKPWGPYDFVAFHDSDLNEGVAEGQEDPAEAYRAHLLKTAPRVMDFLAKTVKGWRPSEAEMLAAIETAYVVMKHTGDVKQAGQALMDELNTLHRMSQGQQDVSEAFGPLPRDSQQIRLGRHTVNIERVGEDKDFIGFAWHDSKGQDHYEEVSVGDLGSYDDLIDRIKQEISYQERQYTDQGVAEAASNSGYKEIEFMCVNPEFPDATDPKLQKQMYAGLKKIPGVIPLLQDHSDYSQGQTSLTAIYKHSAVRREILKLANQLGIQVDLEQPVSDDYVGRAQRGEHEGQLGF
jgi:hypothetical protein